MTWLNNGSILIHNISPNGEKELRIVENHLEFTNISEIDFYRECKNIFEKINNGHIDRVQASYEYANLFKLVNDEQFSYSLCFGLLPICTFNEKKKDFRKELVKLIELFKQPTNKYSNLLYYLAINQSNEFKKMYIQAGGTEPACKLFLEIHNAQNIDWWLEELLLYSTNLTASEFDVEMINHVVSNDIIDCGNFVLTMIITLFFHLLEINCQSIVDYAHENIHVNGEYDSFIFNILVSSVSKEKKADFFDKAYGITKSSLFAAHFISLANYKSLMEVECRRAILRYVEFLSFNKSFRYLIPCYINSIVKNNNIITTSQVLQNILPALIEGINDKKDIEKITISDSYEKEYSLKSIHKLNQLKLVDEDEKSEYITDFLNEDFLECNRNVKLNIMEEIVDYNQNENIFDDLSGVKNSVIVSMIETYLDVDGKDEEKQSLEKSVFDQIALNGDMPEYGI